MGIKEAKPEDILRPLQRTTKWYYVIFGLAALVATTWVALWGWQLQHGLIVTNLGDWGSGGGVTWGLYIGAFIWWVGIAHGGIILSAAVRLLNMDRYQPVARLAELLTISALSMAGLYIVVHTGRPDRLVTSIIPAYPWTVQTSPLAWDVTVITLYFVMTATYLGLTLRYDTYRLRDQMPDMFDPLYEVVLFGYSKAEDEIIERMVWWLALGIIILAPLLLHGGVIPWLFQLLPSMPRWHSAIMGPQFLSIALTSAVAGIIILGYFFRAAYDWEHILTDDVFRGLTGWLGFFSLMFVWLQLQQAVTGVFAARIDVEKVTIATLENPVFIVAISIMVLVLGYIFAQALDERVFSKERSLVAAFVVLYATLSEKVLFVVEGLEYPSFSLYAAVPGHYSPSIIELSSIAGTASLVVIFFLLISKVFPVIELHAVEDAEHHGDYEDYTEGER